MADSTQNNTNNLGSQDTLKHQGAPSNPGTPNNHGVSSNHGASVPVSTSSMAIAGLVLGLIALLTSFIPIVNNISFFLALLGLIFSIVGLVACKRKTRNGLGLAVAALIICIVSGAIVLGTQSLYSNALKEAFTTTGSSSSTSSTNSSNSSNSASSSSGTNNASDTNNTSSTDSSSTSGDSSSSSTNTSKSKYAVTIDSWEAGTDYKGANAAIVTYTFTNNSDDATSFMVAISAKAFQNGVQLESAIVTDIDSQDIMKEIQPGATITVQRGYLLDDNSEITVQCSELISFNDAILAEQSFTL